MNAFDKQTKSITAWCEDCKEVFDILWVAKMHSEQKSHKVKITEFWISGR
jgi:hypothetical protein